MRTTYNDLDAYRRRGLTVDEDFELGITRGSRWVRTIGISLALGILTVTTVAVVRPTFADSLALAVTQKAHKLVDPLTPMPSLRRPQTRSHKV